ncbi:hypothetical protein HK096_002270, partial [Nowakowskiella sp. JEL0078]
KRHHAVEFLKSLEIKELSAYDTIVGVGGDGTLHEIINGILLRSDWHLAVEIPIAMIPTAIINFSCEHPLLSAFYAVRGEKKKIDVNAVTLTLPISWTSEFDLHHGSKKLKKDKKSKLNENKTKKLRVFSHLSVSWGLIPEAELEAESLRWIGLPNSWRFSLSGIWCTLWSKVFQTRHVASLHFHFAMDEDALVKCVQDSDNLPGPSTQFSNLVPLPIDPLEVQYSGVVPRRLPDPWIGIPKSWFTQVSVLNLPWVRSDAAWNPFGRPDDSASELVFTQIDATYGRLPLVKEKMIKVDANELDEYATFKGTGQHFATPSVWFERIKALIIEIGPRRLSFLSPGANVDIDGERYPAGNLIHVEVLPSMITILLPNRSVDPFSKVGELDEDLNPNSTWKMFKEKSNQAAAEEGKVKLRIWKSVESNRRRILITFIGFIFSLIILFLAIKFVPVKRRR